jgi:hypothetical protein
VSHDCQVNNCPEDRIVKFWMLRATATVGLQTLE